MSTGATRINVFAGVTPGFEAQLEAELRALGLEPGPRVAGGLEVRVERAGLWRAALLLRLAESLRVRIGRFAAHNFGQLERGLLRLPWAAYFERGDRPRVRVTTRKSALYHSGAVTERAEAAIAERLAGGDAIPEPDAGDAGSSEVHIRLDHDEALVSIDAAGALLHRRGYRTHVGQAPLRETLAAACLRAAGVGPGQVLWDPFCGSGTLAIEHVAMAAGMPAAAGRRFAFESWPTHDEAAYTALRASLPTSGPQQVVAWASDLAERELEAARHNAAAAGVAAGVALRLGDFEVVARDVPDGAAVVTNLPYGTRSGDPRSVLDTYRRFGALLRRRSDLTPVAVLVGHDGFRRASGLNWTTVVRFKNRGLTVELLSRA